jgi:hypothetical protein
MFSIDDKALWAPRKKHATILPISEIKYWRLLFNGAVSTAIAGSLGKRHHQWINATKPARNATAKSRLRRKRPACDRDNV